MNINDSINLIEFQKDQVEDYKHGLLQQMFVYILCRQFLISVRKSVASNTS
jgi:hypothetical protein